MSTHHPHEIPLHSACAPAPETADPYSPTSAPCPSCGKPVECGARLGLDRCWCGAMPHVLRPPGDPMAACYCEECLRALIASETPGGRRE